MSAISRILPVPSPRVYRTARLNSQGAVLARRPNGTSESLESRPWRLPCRCGRRTRGMSLETGKAEPLGGLDEVLVHTLAGCARETVGFQMLSRAFIDSSVAHRCRFRSLCVSIEGRFSGPRGWQFRVRLGAAPYILGRMTPSALSLSRTRQIICTR